MILDSKKSIYFERCDKACVDGVGNAWKITWKVNLGYFFFNYISDELKQSTVIKN